MKFLSIPILIFCVWCMWSVKTEIKTEKGLVIVPGFSSEPANQDALPWAAKRSREAKMTEALIVDGRGIDEGAEEKVDGGLYGWSE